MPLFHFQCDKVAPRSTVDVLQHDKRPPADGPDCIDGLKYRHASLVDCRTSALLNDVFDAVIKTGTEINPVEFAPYIRRRIVRRLLRKNDRFDLIISTGRNKRRSSLRACKCVTSAACICKRPATRLNPIARLVALVKSVIRRIVVIARIRISTHSRAKAAGLASG